MCVCAHRAAAAAGDPTTPRRQSCGHFTANWVSEAGSRVGHPFHDRHNRPGPPGRHRDRISRNPPGRLLARVADPEPRFLVGARAPHSGRRPGRHAAEPPLPAADRQARGTRYSGSRGTQLRRLYLRNDENDLYSLGYVQDIGAIEYDAWYPMTTLRYRDATLPLRVRAVAFSPFMPGKARESATPGFHFVFTLENTSRETVQASLLSVLDNPIVSRIDDRKLSNTLRHKAVPPVCCWTAPPSRRTSRPG